MADVSSYAMPQQPNMLEGVKNLAGLQQQKIAIDQAKFNLAKDHYDKMVSIVAPLSSDPELSADKVTNTLDYITKMGLITPEQNATTRSQLPSQQELAQNPNALKGKVDGFLMQVQNAQKMFESRFGVRQEIGNTAGTVSGETNPMNPGVFKPKTYIPNQASGATSSLVNQPEIAPDGTPTGRLVETALPDDVKQEIAAGRARLVDGRLVRVAPRVPLASPVSPAGVVAPGNPLVPPSPAASQPSARSGNPLVPRAEALSVGFPTGAPQGSAAAQTALAGTAVASADELRQAAAGVPQSKALIDNIETQLNEANSGPLAKYIQKYGAGINQITKAIAGREPVPRDVVAAHENFVKNATLLQQQQAKALGGTVSALANSEHSVPSLNFSTQGNREIIATLRGTQDAVTAKNNAWQKYLDGGGSNQDFRKFENEFNKTFEPRAYQFPYLTKKEQKKVIEGLPSDSSRKEFFKRAAEALRKGYIKPGAVSE
jgi:hypothetical protein